MTLSVLLCSPADAHAGYCTAGNGAKPASPSGAARGCALQAAMNEAPAKPGNRTLYGKPGGGERAQTKPPAGRRPAIVPGAMDRPLRIALLRYSESPVSDEAEAGFNRRLAEAGLMPGRDYLLSRYSAHGTMTSLKAIIDRAYAANPDLLITFSTPVLRAVLARPRKAPLVFTLVADPFAAGAGKTNDEHAAGATGVYTPAPYAEMSAMLARYFPQIQRVGTLFAAEEPNSVLSKDRFSREAEWRGIVVETIAVDSIIELKDAAQSLSARDIDAVCQIADNMTASGLAVIAQAARNAGKPLFSFMQPGLEHGAVLAVSADFFRAGRETGSLALRILSGEDPSAIPFVRIETTVKRASVQNAARFGLTLPGELLVETGQKAAPSEPGIGQPVRLASAPSAAPVLRTVPPSYSASPTRPAVRTARLPKASAVFSAAVVPPPAQPAVPASLPPPSQPAEQPSVLPSLQPAERPSLLPSLQPALPAAVLPRPSAPGLPQPLPTAPSLQPSPSSSPAPSASVPPAPWPSPPPAPSAEPARLILPTPAGPPPPDEGGQKKWNIDLVELLDVPESEMFRKGLIAGLAESRLKAGQDYELRIRDAGGETEALGSLIQSAASEQSDLLLTMSTPALRAALQSGSKRPIVFALAADPLLLGEKGTHSQHRKNFTGIYESAPFTKMLEIVRRLVPQAKTIGTLYTPGDPLSASRKEELEKAAQTAGYRLEAVANASVEETEASAALLVKRGVQVICQINDSISDVHFSEIGRAAEKAGIALFTFSSAMAEEGAVLAVDNDYYELGREAAVLAAEVLHGAHPGKIPYRSISKTKITLSRPAARRVHLNFPWWLIKQADNVISREAPRVDTGRLLRPAGSPYPRHLQADTAHGGT